MFFCTGSYVISVYKTVETGLFSSFFCLNWNWSYLRNGGRSNFKFLCCIEIKYASKSPIWKKQKHNFTNAFFRGCHSGTVLFRQERGVILPCATLRATGLDLILRVLQVLLGACDTLVGPRPSDALPAIPGWRVPSRTRRTCNLKTLPKILITSHRVLSCCTGIVSLLQKWGDLSSRANTSHRFWLRSCSN